MTVAEAVFQHYNHHMDFGDIDDSLDTTWASRALGVVLSSTVGASVIGVLTYLLTSASV